MATRRQETALVPGTRVQLQGLVSRPELNGLVATVAGPLVGGRHRAVSGHSCVHGRWPAPLASPGLPSLDLDGRASRSRGRLNLTRGRGGLSFRRWIEVAR